MLTGKYGLKRAEKAAANKLQLIPMNNDQTLFDIPLGEWGHKENFIRQHLAQSSFVSSTYKYLYIEVPKAACTRIKYIIHTLEKLPDIPVTFDRLPESRLFMFIHDRGLFKLPSLVSLPDDEASSILITDEYFKFTFVRNPYSRLVSAWKNKLYFIEPGLEKLYLKIKEKYPQHLDGPYVSFEGFIRYICQYENINTCNPHYRLQTQLLYSDAIKYDMIARVENFSDGIKELEQNIGISKLDSAANTSANASDKDDWRCYYNKEISDLVYKTYQSDFLCYGYEKDSWQGGKDYNRKTSREIYLEKQIFDRNRLISRMYQWINSTRNNKGKS